VVTADGQLVTQTLKNTRLIGTARGAVATLALWFLEYRLHPLTVLSGMLLYPLDQAEVLHRFNEFIATAPDELTIRSGFLQTPDGQTMLFLSPTYCGSLKRVSKRSHPANLGTVLSIRCNP